MQITDKLLRSLTEVKYLNADNVDRYRCIMRIFFENYEKLHYWMHQEEVYAQMKEDPYFAEYRPEQCLQDLTILTEWKNLFDTTNEIIWRITRYAAQLSVKNALGANRREEYRKVVEIFLKCENIKEAHKLSAMVFGLERPFHLQGELIRETDSMNQEVYEEKPMDLTLKPRIRTYREKSSRSAIRDSAKEKEETRRQMIQKQKEDAEKMKRLEKDGEIDFSELPIIDPDVREILLKWLSDALESASFSAKTDTGSDWLYWKELQTRDWYRWQNESESLVWQDIRRG